MREKILYEMEVVVPSPALIALIEPYYYDASKKGVRSPHSLASKLRVHLLQQSCLLIGPAMEKTLIVVPNMRRFAGIELIGDRIPDETTNLNFRHLLEKYKLVEEIIETVNNESYDDAPDHDCGRALDRRAEF